MPNTKSAIRMTRKITRRTRVNRDRTSRVRTFIRHVEDALDQGKADLAKDALGRAEPEIARAAQNGILHRRTASRKISRLAQRVNLLQNQQ